MLRVYKYLRDAAHHTDIGLTKLEIDVIDTLEFQRLRGIKQLGFAHLVYPDAVHTRFNHSLGVLHMLEKMIINLENSEFIVFPKDKDAHQAIRLYALLHDITHIPFGHTLEDEANIFLPHDKGPRVAHFWESFVEKRVPKTFLPDLKKMLLPDQTMDRNKVFWNDLVGNTICADLLDYIRRDMYYTGLKMDFDERMFRYFCLHRDAKGSQRFAIRLVKEDKWRIDVVSEILNILRMRYSLAEKVYYHHAKCAASSMLAKAMWSILPDEVKKDKNKEIKALAKFEDNELLSFILDEAISRKEKNAEELIRMLKRRALYKPVFRITLDEASKKGPLADFVEPRRCPEKQRELEIEIEEAAKVKPGSVIIYCPSHKMSLKEAAVMVRWRGEVVYPLNEIKPHHYNEYVVKNQIDNLQETYQALWNMYIFLHPQQFHRAYWVEKAAAETLGVENDPLLVQALRKKDGYREALMLEKEISQLDLTEKAHEAMLNMTKTAYRGRKEEETIKEAVRKAVAKVGQGVIEHAKEKPFSDVKAKKKKRRKKQSEGLFDKQETDEQHG